MSDSTASGTDIAALLGQSRKLLDTALFAMAESRDARADITPIDPDRDWAGRLQRMLGDVRSEATLAISSPIRRRDSYATGGGLLRSLHGAGKQVRLLLSPGYAETREPELYSTAYPLESQVRVATSDFCNTIVIDRRVAVLWAGGADAPRGFLVTEPMLLGAIHEFAVRTWSAAPVFRDHRAGAQLSDATARATLECLAAGLKDEAAARRMSVSLRTYRRYVADLMIRLNAPSRFQLGVRAAELGLLH
ncbi:hypothetical protein [Nocardia sp. NPDC057668]|uniref:hypothetical protein n=1 Tax=Nocardia sp. NPDC057668 TaxID=3346202 RepID=UPI00367102E1